MSKFSTQKILKKQGFKFTLGTKVTACRIVGDSVEVDMESRDGSKKETKTFSKVLVSIGRRPFTEGLGLEEQGVSMEEHSAAPKCWT